MWFGDGDLAPPPRRVALFAQTGIVFSGTLQTLGWGILLFCVPFVGVFVHMTDVTGWLDFRGADSALGTVTEVAYTSSSVNERKVMRYSFRYTSSDGVEREGRSYSTDLVDKGQTVPVEVIPGRPEEARIEGMRRAEFGPELSFVLLFPGVGAVMVFFGLRWGLRANRLASSGTLTTGTLTGRFPTNTRVNGQPVYRLRFRFESDDGAEHTVEVKTHETARLTDEAQERLLYDPRDPRRALPVDAIPRVGRLDGMGNVEAAGSRGLLALILPVLTALAYAALFALLG